MEDLIKEIPIYGGKLIFVVTDKYEEKSKKYKLDFNERDLNCLGLAFEDYYKDRKAYYIFIRETHKDNWGIISHEALHITNFILDYVGIPANNNNDECHCYLLGWIVQTIQKHLEKV